MQTDDQHQFDSHNIPETIDIGVSSGINETIESIIGSSANLGCESFSDGLDDIDEEPQTISPKEPNSNTNPKPETKRRSSDVEIVVQEDNIKKEKQTGSNSESFDGDFAQDEPMEEQSESHFSFKIEIEIKEVYLKYLYPYEFFKRMTLGIQ